VCEVTIKINQGTIASGLHNLRRSRRVRVSQQPSVGLHGKDRQPASLLCYARHKVNPEGASPLESGTKGDRASLNANTPARGMFRQSRRRRAFLVISFGPQTLRIGLNLSRRLCDGERICRSLCSAVCSRICLAGLPGCCLQSSMRKSSRVLLENALFP
jgi:hypothetical protein